MGQHSSAQPPPLTRRGRSRAQADSIQKAAARSPQLSSWPGQGGRAMPPPGSRARRRCEPGRRFPERRLPELSRYQGVSPARGSSRSRSRSLGEPGSGRCPRPAARAGSGLRRSCRTSCGAASRHGPRPCQAPG